MKGVIASLVLLMFFSTAAMAASGVRETPFTLDDRDRLIRLDVRMDAIEKRMDSIEKRMDGLEKKMDDLEKRVDKRIDTLKSDMDKRFDQMMTFMLWGFGILFGGMGVLMTTVIWDRRTALAPVIRKSDEYGQRLLTLERLSEEMLSRLKEDKQEVKIIHALREAAVKDLGIAEALRHAGLL
ncbi:coiled-coil domain-containing protein [Candidatus Magnetominusculus dajiuhuensis]|uniref:coiled-coil domain-containing protein n=1 Tax=Candidatus Magnetominusculus dajiuhuensis TaxID=3137712 RepID=UPI003B42BE95